MQDCRFRKRREDDRFCFEHGKHAFGVHCNQDVLLRLQVLLIRQEQRIKSSFSLPWA